jgi:GntR family transcriptional regulator
MLRPMEVDYEAADPPYKQIAAWIRERIEAGEFPPGRRLPTEKALQQETGIAATTARRAYRLLAEEGLIRTVPGRGSYVSRRAG